MNEIEKKIEQAKEILIKIGMPKDQQNDRTALCLLALLGLTPNNEWMEAKINPLGITPIMDFISVNYEKSYKPNTRETIRKDSIQQFVDAGVAVANPDNPERPVNSPNWFYVPSDAIVKLAKSYGSESWNSELESYLENNVNLVKKYAWERELAKVPVAISEEIHRNLSGGAHSQLIKGIIETFRAQFISGAEVIYVGDTGSKWSHSNKEALKDLGLIIDEHGKMPDVVFYHSAKNWLILVEAVTSVGPIDGKRYDELHKLFSPSSAELVFVTAFPDRTTSARFLPKIAWETEVWIAENPTHMIHFNGDKFLGPHS